MNINDTFLESYKDLETVLRKTDPQMTVLAYEESLDADQMEKLRICRQFRNYISHHNNESFLIATKEMVAFIQKMTLQVSAKLMHASDALYRLTPVKMSDTLAYVIKKFAKTKRTWLPVVKDDGTYVCVIDMQLLITVLSVYKDKTTLNKVAFTNTSGPDVYVTTKDDLLENCLNKTTIITDNKNKYQGIIKAL